MKTVIFHGRSGQPAAQLADLLAAAALQDGLFSQSWRVFSITPVRGPIAAVARIADHYIRARTEMTIQADLAVVLDPTLIPLLGASPASAVLTAPLPARLPLPAGWQVLEVPPIAVDREILAVWISAVARASGLVSEAGVAAAVKVS